MGPNGFRRLALAIGTLPAPGAAPNPRPDTEADPASAEPRLLEEDSRPHPPLLPRLVPDMWRAAPRETATD